MAITPYEALAMIPKSQEASLFRTNQMQRENAQQAQIAGTVQQQTEQKMQRTEKADQKDDTPFKYDAKEKGNNAYQQQQENANRNVCGSFFRIRRRSHRRNVPENKPRSTAFR